MTDSRDLPLLPIGMKTPIGTITGILWIGERYYSTDKDGGVGLVPATVFHTMGVRP